jgi:hypothetical protein
MRRRPYSFAAIVLGLLLWGFGIKLGSGYVNRQLGSAPSVVEVEATGAGRYVHPRRR